MVTYPRLAALLAISVFACSSSDENDNPGSGGAGGGQSGAAGGAGVSGAGTGATGTGATGTGATGTGATGTGATGTGATGTGATGSGGAPTIAQCQGKTYQCGDTVDNDKDGLIDSEDPDCFGPCDNNESGYKGNIPGQAAPPCLQDCYFDQDSGSGNDQCFWDHRCDKLSVAPNYPPEGDECKYDPNTKVINSGPPWSCDKARTSQEKACTDYCGPLTPNGCDCFGCCNVPGASTPIWLGSKDSSDNGTCTLKDVGDPSKCKPCTIVTGCFNDCKECELCLGKTTLPPSCFPGTGGSPGTGGAGGTAGSGGSGGTGGSCVTPVCPAGVQPCGVSCLPGCPNGDYCLTGCCVATPK